MTASVVDRLHGEFSDLLSLLDSASEISLRSTADDNFRKALLLSAASYFEQQITNTVLSFVDEKTIGTPLVTSFVRNKAVSRQYHTWFAWEGNNANRFFALFGDDFRKFMKQRVKANHQLSSAIAAFLELGRDRNRLVHQNYGSFSVEKTSEEIHKLYRTALIFVEELPVALRKFSPTS